MRLDDWVGGGEGLDLACNHFSTHDVRELNIFFEKKKEKENNNINIYMQNTTETNMTSPSNVLRFILFLVFFINTSSS